MTCVRVILAVVLCAGTALSFGPPDGVEIELPLNEIMVLAPFDGEVVEHGPLTVQVATGYGVLTFLAITVNGRAAVDVGNIDVGATGLFEIGEDLLRVGENILEVNSWHQLPGRPQRLAEFDAPPVHFTVKKPAPPPVGRVEILEPREGETVSLADLEVKVLSRYRGGAFMDMHLNGKMVVSAMGASASATNTCAIAKEHLKPGKNALRLVSWQLRGGNTNRVETYTAPVRSFLVSDAVKRGGAETCEE